MKDNERPLTFTVLTQRSRTIKNKLPITWIGKLVLEENALVIFNCSACNVQADSRSLTTCISITVDDSHSSHNATPPLKVRDKRTPPKCSVSFTVFLEKGEHRFEVKATTEGEGKDPSQGELYYDYCALIPGSAVDKPVVSGTPKKKIANKKTSKNVSKKISKKTAQKKSSKKKTAKKTNRKKAKTS